ncbi:MAG: class I SAM-dependent methyltransferase [Chitinispirillaceae bacterium]
MNKVDNYWDEIYEKKLVFKTPLNRAIQREKYFYSFLRGKLKNKTLIDLGCGDSRQVIYYLNPVAEECFYIGMDNSKKSLKLTNQNENIAFVQFDINKLPVKKQSADIMFCFGLLMYFRNYEELLREMTSCVKPGGRIFFYESIVNNTLRRNRNSHIDFKQFVDILSNCGKITFVKKDYSPIRTILICALDKLKLINLKWLMRFAIVCDIIMINTIGKVNSFFDGRAVFIKWQKE